MENVPCVNNECLNYDSDCPLNCPLNCGLELGEKIKKCATYKAAKPKRLITAKELFEAGATHVVTPHLNASNFISTIIDFNITSNKILINNVVYGEEESVNFCWLCPSEFSENTRWTADRKNWHDFMVEDNGAIRK